MLKYHNRQYLLNLKPKYFSCIFILLTFLSIILICSLTMTSYDVTITNAYLQCQNECSFDFKVSLDKTEDIMSSKYLKIANEQLEINNIVASEIKVDNETKTNYQIITVTTNKIAKQDNMFYKIYLYHNKEKIIKKIKTLFF